MTNDTNAITSIIKGFDDFCKGNSSTSRQEMYIKLIRETENESGLYNDESIKAYINAKMEMQEQQNKERLLKQYAEQYTNAVNTEFDKAMKEQLEPQIQKMFDGISRKA